MCGQIVLWACLLGFAGGFGGVMLADHIWNGDGQALTYGLVIGAMAGAAAGAGGVLLVAKRGPGD